MSKDFLSQDEVDALLKGVNGDADEAPQAVDEGSIRPYNLAKQERIVRGRMPTLEIINERLARQLRIGIFNLIRRTAEVVAGPVRVVKYSEFIRNLVVPTNINVTQVKPLRGLALFVFDPSLVFLVIDNLFGGDGRFHTRVEGREFTQTEQRIIQRLLGVVFEEYEKAWAPVHPLSFEHVRSEMHTQFANIATPNEVVVVVTFKIELGNGGGELHICMPYSMLEPIREKVYSATNGEQLDVDKRWVQLLSQQVKLAEVEVVASLAKTQVTLQQVMGMREGDVISLEVPSHVTATVDGVPVLECRYGVANGQYALRVERLLSPDLY